MSVDLFLDEKKFISVKRASEETGYAQDYIGQLCRHGKIPAKLIGRTWFVNLESILEYKRKIGFKNPKKSETRSQPNIDLGTPILASSYKPLDYKTEDLVELPNLGFQKKPLISNKKILSTKFVTTASAIVMTFVIVGSSFSWLNYVAPRHAEVLNQELLLAYDNFLGVFEEVAKRIQVALAGATSLLSQGGISDNQGLVVFPDSSNREELTSDIQNQFSDEVEILFDEAGESGIIRPVFKSSENSDDYAFVLVPIEKKE